ncbi:hypothetical protein D3C77_778640 [compost metagenome]
MALQCCLDLLVKVIAQEQLRDDVHGNGQRFSSAYLNLRTKGQGLVEDMPTQAIEQVGALDERKKLRR